MSIPDLKESFKQNIKPEEQTENQKNTLDSELDVKPVFRIEKKTNDKPNRKAFNVQMDEGLVKDLDKICKKTGWSRNELINKMCEWCVNNIEID